MTEKTAVILLDVLGAALVVSSGLCWFLNAA